ncbi:hypothetical protein E2C01_054306 [Portunus trituberculatus]|uniref:Uncharacterized protein n=1 Tax=Portunus trituberculatus TaxID=210409 RepID=A0A5B7GSU4_PORTR|nr:hypothetical protein [Portunus trituberculatus]
MAASLARQVLGPDRFQFSVTPTQAAAMTAPRELGRSEVLRQPTVTKSLVLVPPSLPLPSCST